jgi:hypothetical protein
MKKFLATVAAVALLGVSPLAKAGPACPTGSDSKSAIETYAKTFAGEMGFKLSIDPLTWEQAGRVLAQMEKDIGPPPAHSQVVSGEVFIYRHANGEEVGADIAFFDKADCSNLSGQVGAKNLPTYEKLWQ